MAGLISDVTSFAGSALKGFFGTDYLRDAQHASKTFIPNNYGYAPKYKFLFHVYFDINAQYIDATQNWPNDRNFGLTVKTINLPKYAFDTTILNQYNRKRIVQTKIKYEPITITTHDDNSNLLRNMWFTYYSYYYKDPSQSDVNSQSSNAAANKFSAKVSGNKSTKTNQPNNTPVPTSDINSRNIYDSNIDNSNDWGYIGEPGGTNPGSFAHKKVPFFKAINIYGFNQHNFVLYRLINPIITSFDHDTYDYKEGSGTMESSISLDYETVLYGQGAIDGTNPNNIVAGFGDKTHYDTVLSPISTPGSSASILGQGGLVDAAGGVFDALPDNPLGALQTIGKTINTFKNVNLVQLAKSEVTALAVNSIQSTPNRNNAFDFSSASQSAIKNGNDAIKPLIEPKTGR